MSTPVTTPAKPGLSALIGVMDICVDRNAFGRQVDSFETDLAVAGLAGAGVLPPASARGHVLVTSRLPPRAFAEATGAGADADIL